MRSEPNRKVALVTAASKGLGFASAMGLAQAGCDLVICSRGQEAIEKAAQAIRQATGRNVVALAADVSQQADLDSVVVTAMEQYGGVDILVSNTGGPPPGRFTDFDDAAWQGAFESLLLPAVRLTRAVLPTMRERGWGRLIYITSSGVKQPIPNLILSNSLRAAVTGMMKTLATQVAGEGITANCVAPGRIATDRVASLDQAAAQRTGRPMAEIQAESAAKIPAGRYGTPEEFASLVVYLASPAASYLTGSTFSVDGGMISSLL